MVDKLFLWRAAVTEALVLISIALESILTGWPHKPQDPRVKIPLFLFRSHGAYALNGLSERDSVLFQLECAQERQGCQTTPPHQQTKPSPCGPQPSPLGMQSRDPPGTRGGFTLPCQAPVLCEAGHGCSFCLTRGEHVTAWESPQVQLQAHNCSGKYLSYYLIAN